MLCCLWSLNVRGRLRLSCSLPHICILRAWLSLFAGVEAFLEDLRVGRSYEAVRQWVQRFGAGLKGYFEGGRARVAVIDETEIKVGNRWYWLWLAIEPTRRKILAMALTQTRNGLVARSLLKELKRRYGRLKVVTDGGTWYPFLGCPYTRAGARGSVRWHKKLRRKNHRDRQGQTKGLRQVLPLPMRRPQPRHQLSTAIRPVLQPRPSTPNTRRATRPVKGETEFERICNLMEVIKS